MDTKRQRNQTLLQEFLQNIEEIPSDLVTELLKVTQDKDAKNIINAFTPPLTNQFKELSSYISELSSDASKQVLADIETTLKISSGITLAKSLKTAYPSIGSIVGRIGIVDIIHQIKKVISMIVDLLIEYLHLPSWIGKLVHSILDLIDEIINAIIAIFGKNSINLRTALSQMEQNYLAELTQLAKLKNANNHRVEKEED